MAELRPIPLATLLTRAYHEYTRSRAIFDLPARSFYRTPDFSGFAPTAGRADLDSRMRGNDDTPDLSVAYAGTRAPNPIGPAAGPHTQLAQNIVLSWLAGAGVIELKTVQAKDRLTLSRPCIDMKTVGYNTEWSQELRLDESLREYVKASMLIEMLAGRQRISPFALPRGSTRSPRPEAVVPRPGSGRPSVCHRVEGRGFVEPSDQGPVVEFPNTIPVFDISVGYDLAGITSAPVVRWLEQMKDASAIVDELRAEIPDEFAALKGLPFQTAVSQSVTLSTFHGAPAGEIERICAFLIGEMGFHTVIKLNPPMLGREQVEHILHGELGYEDIDINPEIYDRELPFDEAVDLVRRLQQIASRAGVTVGVKCGNTLEVRNTGSYLQEPVQYLSGQPLHALHAALALRWREVFGTGLLISFAGGVDARNAADCVAAGLVPVTTCTDVLRPGGYARLPKYLRALESRMKQVGARTIDDFIAKSAALVAASAPGGQLSPSGQSRPSAASWRGGSAAPRGGGPGRAIAVRGLRPDRLGQAVVENARHLARRALADDRYRADGNRKPPRKLGTHLWLWDCLSCRKCIPVCPNDAIFEIETESFVGEVPVIEISAHGWREAERRLYRALKTTQIIIYADACNDCGNCDVFCPEDGGPNLEKPRFFGSIEAYQQAAPLTGFVLTGKRDGRSVSARLLGRFAEGEYRVEYESGSPTVVFVAPAVRLSIDWVSHEVLGVLPDPESRVPQGSAAPARSPESLPPVHVGVSLEPYLTLRLLLGALLNTNRVNFVNAGLLV